MLSEMWDRTTRKSTAGIRVDVPDFLRRAEKTLEEYGRRIRAMHGRGTKHHTKFDDMETTIYLNIRKQGDLSWTRVYEDQAREWVQKMRKEDSELIKQKFHKVDKKALLQQQSSSYEKESNVPTAAAESNATKVKKTSGWTGRAGSANEPMS